MVVLGETGMDGGQQHPKDHGGQVGLDAEPGDGDHGADQSGNLCPVDAETDAADDRKRHPGFLAHVARQVHEAIHQRRADAQGQENLPAAQAQGIEADGKRVVGDVVHIVGPQREDAVATPAPAFRLRWRQVLVVQAGAEHDRGFKRLPKSCLGDVGGG
ncbi:hypothetical protein D3C76_927170 [compost metagenome]